MRDNNLYSGDANNADRIPTPGDQENCAATDFISEAVAGTMDNIQEEFTGTSEQTKKTE